MSRFSRGAREGLGGRGAFNGEIMRLNLVPRFRMTCNEVAATLTRSDATAHAMTTGNCARHESRFWLLAAVSPYPANKWLPAGLAATDGAVDLLDAARAAQDPLIGSLPRSVVEQVFFRTNLVTS